MKPEKLFERDHLSNQLGGFHASASPQVAIEHRPPQNLSDSVAWRLTRLLRWVADRFFAGRYGHRAVVLETVAAVPGIVAGMLVHLRCLRRMEGDRGWIRTLLDEADNERMHLMTFLAIAQPNRLERIAILLAQGVFFNFFFMLYLFHPRTAHRLVGYFEEEAVISYTQFLESIDAGRIANVPAPSLAIDYWQLAPDACLRDVVLAVRADEAGHRDTNHGLADQLSAVNGGPMAVQPSYVSVEANATLVRLSRQMPTCHGLRRAHRRGNYVDVRPRSAL